MDVILLAFHLRGSNVNLCHGSTCYAHGRKQSFHVSCFLPWKLRKLQNKMPPYDAPPIFLLHCSRLVPRPRSRSSISGSQVSLTKNRNDLALRTRHRGPTNDIDPRNHRCARTSNKTNLCGCEVYFHGRDIFTSMKVAYQGVYK